MKTVTKTFEFSASHRLIRDDWSDERNQHVFGRCFRGHGHTYRLEVTVAGAIDPETGMIVDSRILGSIVREHVVADLDHFDLNTAVPWLQGKLTTAEVLVDAIWDRLEGVLAEQSVQLTMLRLWETNSFCATRTAE
ncbi:MAG: 6-carboxytetrahydropterin synthase [Bdellovibrionales bacterium]|nr:6-carboxytetrahydropterin synthase [Bdellovibrionales bacterium]